MDGATAAALSNHDWLRSAKLAASGMFPSGALARETGNLQGLSPSPSVSAVVGACTSGAASNVSRLCRSDHFTLAIRLHM
jgi:hypothetical protein